MLKKQIWELSPSDLLNHAVWLFPMNYCIGNDETIMPADHFSQLEDLQVIVRTYFRNPVGNSYIGYIYWGYPATIEYLKPVMFFNNSDKETIYFWTGIVTPECNHFPAVAPKANEKDLFPFSFVSDAVYGLDSISGTLNGIYYLRDDGHISHVKLP